ncbi:hypothetical protein ACG02S_07800 [Roseateles sp. DC23W]|uniref:Uncharacterized protein n=1 Tax=Pelomonas dachongensis TaxID=3299029 RepID=A0ABW7EJZ8_9BURK
MAGRGQIAFHSGALFVKGTGANPRALRVATLQETSFDFKASNKELTGENMFAEAIGRGNIKISGKAKSGRFNGALMNQLFFAQPDANILSQAKLIALDEPGTVATATVTVANGTNFLEDLGVQSATTGEQYERVTSAPAAKQYSVNEATGVYTFNATENTNSLLFSYLHKTVAAGAKTLKITNQLAGEAPTFKGIFSTKFQGQTLTLTLNALVSESLAFGFKNEDFSMPDFSFAAQVDSLGAVGELSMTQFQ